MVKDIIRDIILLARKSADATPSDMKTAIDLRDTLMAHSNECVGMAANMIGVSKRIIVFDFNGSYMTMFNPEITDASGKYEAEEGCLSLMGLRRTERFQKITVKYQDLLFHWQQEEFTGWTAQIIQHEIDHCNGIII